MPRYPNSAENSRMATNSRLYKLAILALLCALAVTVAGSKKTSAGNSDNKLNLKSTKHQQRVRRQEPAFGSNVFFNGAPLVNLKPELSNNLQRSYAAVLQQTSPVEFVDNRGSFNYLDVANLQGVSTYRGMGGVQAGANYLETSGGGGGGAGVVDPGLITNAIEPVGNPAPAPIGQTNSTRNQFIGPQTQQQSRCGCNQCFNNNPPPPSFVNPCPEVAGIQSTGNRPLSCAVSLVCPIGYWCHIGADSDTTVCCSIRSSDQCSVPLVVGSGNNNLPRFYYDATSRQCRSFSYRGLYGNENNFINKENCEQACPTWTNPCPSGQPILNADNRRPQVCNPQSPCPASYWCHLGASTDTTVCCPQTGDPCRLSFTTGVGESSLPRWYYAATSRTCRAFNYHGLRGNSNNFLSREDCEATCPVWVNPCANGQPILGNDGRPQVCQPRGGSSCPMNYYCHFGFDATTTACCTRNGNEECQQPMSEGTGQYSIPRWYFDGNSRQCRQFTYRGLRGNENNFQTRGDCESTCPVFVNPCPTPLSQVTMQINYCSATNPTCPGGQWCHVGADSESTVCCPNAGNPCIQSQSLGSGSQQLRRFAYDSNSRTCNPFQYSGIGGNQNNFVSRQECEQRCPVFVNPCVGSDPLLVQGRPQTCSPQSPCPSTYWCHIGADADTTVCCPNARDPCTQSQTVGLGDNTLSRWYFNPNSLQCGPFNYRGLKGNQNNFLSREDCERTCPVFRNPCAEGQPPPGPGGRPLQCSARQPGICPRSYWCHVGEAQDTTVCCPGAGNPCVMQMTRGTGVSQLPRWYYNSLTRQCVQFIYSGTMGNQNSFLSQQDCEATCPVYINPCVDGDPLLDNTGRPVRCSSGNGGICGAGYWCHIGADQSTTACCIGSQNPCQMPQSQGRGQSNLPRWYYNAVTRQCVSFTYRGLYGNQNNFLTKNACEQKCPVWVNPCAEGEPPLTNGQPRFCSELNPNCPNGYWCHFGADRDTTVCCPGRGNACNMPQIRGSGQASLTRWYYSGNSRTCNSFQYAGMMGNQNNFLSRQDCETVCPVFENPCPTGDPALVQGRPVRCSFGSNNCGAGFWCHLGANPETTVCCRGSFTPCSGVPMNPGLLSSGPADDGRSLRRKDSVELERWFYNSFTKQCLPFTYRGAKGNTNNFLTKKDCLDFCPALQTACTGLGPVQGEGTSVLPRWYYDLSGRQCRSFNYRGIRGNPNNFLSKNDCEQTCPVWTNPCPLPVESPVYCSAGGFGDVCGVGQWCHIGADRDSTVCCPGAGDPCTMPRNNGIGNTVLSRFYYDVNSRQCVPFNYRGTKGNQNNFLSRDDCEGRCPVFRNPCSGGDPYLGLDGRPATCNALTTTSSCPSDYWCHVGADIETTVCCPGSADPCIIPQAIGNGQSNLPRWYYNSGSQQCEQFTYSGMGGNQNNFVSQQACRLVCRKFENPCIGQPAQTPSGQPIFCSITNIDNCPVNFWCHLGGTPETTLCCPGATNPCSVPLAPGSGTSNLPRWYYNADSRRCVQFTYNGKGGNQNNFLSASACGQTCPVWENPCANGRPAPSPGSQNRPLQCGSFYGRSSCPNSYWCHVGREPEDTICCPGAVENVCNLPKVSGTGDVQLPRWYFNPVTQKCTSFNYSGRGGNQNNFQSREDCLNECPEFLNPCAIGEPEMEGSEPKRCALFLGPNAGCSFGYFCLSGDPSEGESNYCCPNMGDPCGSKVREGDGTANLQRWYFNPQSRNCEEFYYRGRKGNENNFVNRNDCETQCIPDVNPCFVGSEPMKQGGRNLLCRPDRDTCPKGTHYCHVGEDEYSTVCCPRRGDPCRQQRLLGSGTASLARYYYSQEDDLCKKFQYSGRGGNENNFLSLNECEDQCPGFRGYCPHAKPLLVGGVPQECGVETACPSNFVCHINTRISKSVCCQDPGLPSTSVTKTFFSSTSSTVPPTTRPTTRITTKSPSSSSTMSTRTQTTTTIRKTPPSPPKTSSTPPPKTTTSIAIPETPPLPFVITSVGDLFSLLRERGELSTADFRETARIALKLKKERSLKINQEQKVVSLRPEVKFSSKESNRVKNGKMSANKDMDEDVLKVLDLISHANMIRVASLDSKLFLPASSTTSSAEPQKTNDRSQEVSQASKDHRQVSASTSTVSPLIDRWNAASEAHHLLPPTVYIGGRVDETISMETENPPKPSTKKSIRVNATPSSSKKPPKQIMSPTGQEYIDSLQATVRLASDMIKMAAPYFCVLPRDPGPCKDFGTKFGYNRNTGTCTPFQYGSCGGNMNTFDSLETCTEICCDKGYK